MLCGGNSGNTAHTRNPGGKSLIISLTMLNLPPHPILYLLAVTGQLPL